MSSNKEQKLKNEISNQEEKIIELQNKNQSLFFEIDHLKKEHYKLLIQNTKQNEQYHKMQKMFENHLLETNKLKRKERCQ